MPACPGNTHANAWMAGEERKPGCPAALCPAHLGCPCMHVADVSGKPCAAPQDGSSKLCCAVLYVMACDACRDVKFELEEAVFQPLQFPHL